MAAARGRRASASTHMAAASAADIPATADVATATTTDVSAHVAAAGTATHTWSAASADATAHAWCAAANSHAAIADRSAGWTARSRTAIDNRPWINDRSGIRAIDVGAACRPRTDPGAVARI